MINLPNLPLEAFISVFHRQGEASTVTLQMLQFASKCVGLIPHQKKKTEFRGSSKPAFLHGQSSALRSHWCKVLPGSRTLWPKIKPAFSQAFFHTYKPQATSWTAKKWRNLNKSRDRPSGTKICHFKCSTRISNPAITITKKKTNLNMTNGQTLQHLHTLFWVWLQENCQKWPQQTHVWYVICSTCEREALYMVSTSCDSNTFRF